MTVEIHTDKLEDVLMVIERFILPITKQLPDFFEETNDICNKIHDILTNHTEPHNIIALCAMLSSALCNLQKEAMI